jgi:hypothetical protein
MKNRWGKLAGQLGILYCLAGLFLVFLGWNGAATYDRVSAQVPYLVSGGLAGLSLVVIGGSVLVASSAREGSAALQATVAELREAVERLSAGQDPVRAASTGTSSTGTGSTGAGSVGSTSASAGSTLGDQPVVAGPNAYHRPDCRLVDGQTGSTAMTASSAAERGLSACRICTPDRAGATAG